MVTLRVTPDEASHDGRILEEVVPNQLQVPARTADYFHDDDASGEMREYTGVFEGPEKTLEVCFRNLDGSLAHGPVESEEKIGLRRLNRDEVARICGRARCTILSSVSNRYLDAYVLSESSLFIYPYMLVLKTCGTTTLLRCISLLIDFGRKLGLGKSYDVLFNCSVWCKELTESTSVC